MTDLPTLHIQCETKTPGLMGTTSLDVIRVEQNDDGSFTAVTDHWPADIALEKDRVHILRDMVDTLKTELRAAVKVAYQRGATVWTKQNFPEIYEELRPKPPANLKLSDTQEKALLYMSEHWNDENPQALTFKEVQDFAGIPPTAARRTVRALARKGLAEYAKGFMDDDGRVWGGSGYSITKEGYEHALKLMLTDVDGPGSTGGNLTEVY
jgi:hypothetical protein